MSEMTFTLWGKNFVVPQLGATLHLSPTVKVTISRFKNSDRPSVSACLFVGGALLVRAGGRSEQEAADSLAKQADPLIRSLNACVRCP